MDSCDAKGIHIFGEALKCAMVGDMRGMQAHIAENLKATAAEAKAAEAKAAEAKAAKAEAAEAKAAEAEVDKNAGAPSQTGEPAPERKRKHDPEDSDPEDSDRSKYARVDLTGCTPGQLFILGLNGELYRVE
jgi:hypothetical protein